MCATLCLSLNRFLAPLHDHSLVVTVTNLSSLNDKRMLPGLALAPRAKGVWPSAHQKWTELSKDTDDRVSLQAFGGSEQENSECNKGSRCTYKRQPLLSLFQWVVAFFLSLLPALCSPAECTVLSY